MPHHLLFRRVLVIAWLISGHLGGKIFGKPAGKDKPEISASGMERRPE
jgi:hypothetical protein